MNPIRRDLLRWYDGAARDLPWRRTRDPYAIWVSEVMLQQTRVETVIPYYERFLERFPTPQALAEADEDTVLSHWSGLGYYRRARLLHAGVREVVAQYGGKVPEDAQRRLDLPGVGRYTAGAIGSIAFDKEEPIVDGNVTRVLARVFGVRTPVGSSETTRRLWELAAQLVPGQRPGAFNQALMELGATLCTPKQAACDACPLVEHCEAHARGELDELPLSKPRKAPIEFRLTAVVASSGRGTARSVWLTKGDAALFGGLWGVPMTEGPPRDALRRAGVRARLQAAAVGQVDHVLTHRHMRIDVFRATGARAEASASRRSFTAPELARVGISSLTKKLLAAAR